MIDMFLLCPESCPNHHSFFRYFCSRFLTRESDCSISCSQLKHTFFMRTEVPTFDAMPQMMANILEKLESLEQKFDALQSNNNVESDVWFSLQDLCNYLPNHPAEQTVYGWTSNRTIPFHKNGKCIIFRKSEIDNWLMQTSRKSVNDIYDEAHAYVVNNPKGRKEVTRNHV